MNIIDKEYFINAQGIQKSFGDVSVLKNVNLKIKRGEVVVIVGPSGSGKSTLLRSLIKLDDIDKGEIYVDDNCLVKNLDDGVKYASCEFMQKILLKFGMVFQDFSLFPHMTVLENVALAPMKVFGFKKEDAFCLAKKNLEEVELGDKCDFYPCELSGGQKQRIAIARVLAMNPEVILFDEPTSALDPELASGVLSIIRKIVLEKNKTIIVVTHNMNFALGVADRIIFMENGRIIEDVCCKEGFRFSKESRANEFFATSYGVRG